MFKKCLLILTTAGAIAIAAPFASAQDNRSDNPANGQTTDQTTLTARRAHERGCGHHYHAPDPAGCTAELTNRLNLTPDQQAKVLSALQSESSQMQIVRTATESQIRGVLDSNQQKDWDQMQTGRGQRTENRGGTARDSRSGPAQ
jgi:hypothetical protein